MHPEARAYVATHAGRYPRVVDVGGRDINGRVRDLFDCDEWTTLDLEDGPAVDIVIDCREWKPDEPVDLVLCLEVLEHAPEPESILLTCLSYLAPGGRLVLTCAAPERAPHSGHDGGTVRDGEHYAGIVPADLVGWLTSAGLAGRMLHFPERGDLYVDVLVP
jgi:SAM-dependent methyltransferase